MKRIRSVEILGAATVAVAALALGAMTHSVGGARHFFDVLVAQVLVLGLGVAAVMSAARSDGVLRRSLRTMGTLAVAVCCVVAIAVLPPSIRPLIVSAAGAALIGIGAVRGPTARTVRTIAHAAVVVGAYVALSESPTALHTAREAWARAVSTVATLIQGEKVALGPSAAGVDMVVIAAALLWVRPPARLHWTERIMQATSLAVLQLAFVLVAAGFANWQARWFGLPHAGGVSAFDAGWLFAVATGVFGGIAHAAVGRAGAVEKTIAAPNAAPSTRVLHGTSALGLFTTVLLAAVLVAGVLDARPAAATANPLASPPRVAIHGIDGLDMRLVDPDARGMRASGMFGFLPPFLRACGYDVLFIDIEDDEPEAHDVLVLVNLPETPSQAAIDRIRSFVEGGGGLLLAGDHTGAEQIRLPSNAIVGSWGIELAFDSAVALRDSWADGKVFLRHPVTRTLEGETDLQVWTGASLALSRPAYPLVVGRVAFSDEGDASGRDASNLGDLRLGRGERVGDLALIAASEPGRGRVLVFGDTSPLQVMALGHARPFVRDAFDWLSRRTPERERRWWPTIAMALLVAWSFVSGLRSRLAALVLAGLVVVDGTHARPEPWQTPPLDTSERPIAHIDLAHGENVTRLGWFRRGVGGLQQCLFRAGYAPFLPSRWDATLLSEASLSCWVAPTIDVSEAAWLQLDDWMRGGGVLLLAVGQPEAARVPRLLAGLGLSVGTTPLGPAECEHDGLRLRLAAAFELHVPPGAAIAASAYGRPVSAWIPRGRGGAFVVADSQFLANWNLEDYQTHVAENVEYVVDLLTRLREAQRTD